MMANTPSPSKATSNSFFTVRNPFTSLCEPRLENCGLYALSAA